MAYNNQFPINYQPYYPQIQQQQNSIIWVQGEAGAKSYLVAPNTSIALWDSETQTVYLKSADASGMPSMKILDYTIRDSEKPAVEQINYATKEDLDSLKKELNDLRSRMKNSYQKGKVIRDE